MADVRPRPTTDDGFRSDRYYRAAAALAGGRPERRSIFDRIQDAERNGVVWPDGLADEMRRHLGEREDALQLLDRAAPLTFEGLSHGTDGSLSSLFVLARLAGLRTVSLVIDRDPARAIESSYAELRLRPVVDWAWPIFAPRFEEVDRLGRVLSATHPAAAALLRVAGALADLDRDDRLKRWFLGRRAALLGSSFVSGPLQGRVVTDPAAIGPFGLFDGVGLRGALLGQVLGQPWFERQLRRRIDVLSAVLIALDQPWPERIDAVARVYDTSSSSDDRFRRPDVSVSQQIVDDLALVRAARVVVAIERYRREHRETMPPRLDDLVPAYLAAVPVDPYSGWPLLFRAEARSYVVYSLGPNQRDDGGDFSLLRFVQAARQSRDVGIRIQDR